MADSDEESDRKKRDKFRRERSDYSSNERRRSDSDGRRAPSWREEYYEARRRSREEERERGRNSSPPSRREWSPPDSKRFRRSGGWEELVGGPPPVMSPYGMIEVRGPWMVPSHGEMPPRGSPGSRSLPGDVMLGFSPGSRGFDPGRRGSVLLTFKQFLAQQDDGIDDMEAVKLYHQYKDDFKKKQILHFFNEHKEEEWFLSKYHPKHVEKVGEVSKTNLLKRLEVFEGLRERASSIPVIQEETDSIIKLMDTMVILLEGGTELDLKTLEEEEEEQEEEEEGEKEKSDTCSNAVSEREGSEEKEEKEIEEMDEERRGTKRSRGDDDDDDDNDLIPTETKKSETEYVDEATGDSSPVQDIETGSVSAPPTASEEPQPETGQSESEVQSEMATPGTENEDDQSKSESPAPQQVKPLKPRPLHLTKAVYLRHITPQVSASDIVEACKNLKGFLRVGLAEVQPDRGFERRGWVTFSHDTDIKNVSVKLGTMKVKNFMLTCQINRDLSRRVKATPTGVVWSRRAIESDLRLLVKLIHHFDKKSSLWSYSVANNSNEGSVTNNSNEDKGEEVEQERGETDAPKENPVLCSIDINSLTSPPVQPTSDKDTASEEQEKEEEEEEGERGEEEEGVISDPGTEILKSSSTMIQNLDMLIWYLRLVHSFDYYNCSCFFDEDLMPNRCGIITARTAPPTAVTNEEVNTYIKSMEERVESLLKEKVWIKEEEMEKLGKKEQESEVEKFIEANTQKLGESKYLCPLSGKKFRGPEFVRKHIMNKHKQALEDVKDETDFFNNYLKDPERPDSILTGGGDDERRGRWSGHQNPMLLSGFHDLRRGRGGRGFRGRPERRGGVGGRRPVRSYNDLDVPEDMY